MMSKKVYQAFADALNLTRPDGDTEHIMQWRTDVEAVATVLRTDNPAFSKTKFLEAMNIKN